MKMKKIVSAIAALSLVAALAVGGTLAYLQSVTKSVVNTFVIGDGISLTLTETEGTEKEDAYHREFTLVPGSPVAKDPKVEVTEADGGPFYVFVKIEEGKDIDSYYTYDVNEYNEASNPTGWKKLDGADAIVYYREVNAADGDPVSVLKDDCIKVNSNVSAIAAEDDLSLTFTAYAIQTASFSSVLDAWNAVKIAVA